MKKPYKSLLATGGPLDTVADTIFFSNNKKDRIETSLGLKTLIGLKELLANIAIAPLEVATAIFSSNENEGKVATGHGNKTLAGLTEMVETARLELGGETQLIEDSVVRFKNYYLNKGGITEEDKLVDAYLKKQNANRVMQELADKPYEEVDFSEHKRYFPELLGGYYFNIGGEEKQFRNWGVWDSKSNLFTGIDATPDRNDREPQNNDFTVMEQVADWMNKGEIKPEAIYNVTHVRYQAMELGGEAQLINDSVVDFKNYYLTNTGLTPSRFAKGGPAPKGKLVISATSKEKAEKMLNDYHYSTTFKIDGNQVNNKNGVLPYYYVEEKGGKTKVYRIMELGGDISVSPDFDVYATGSPAEVNAKMGTFIESLKEKGGIITDKDKILEFTKKINDYKLIRNSSIKGTPTYNSYVKSIDIQEARLVKDKNGNTIGIKPLSIWSVEVRKTKDSYWEELERNLRQAEAEIKAKEYLNKGYYEARAEIPLPFESGGDLQDLEIPNSDLFDEGGTLENLVSEKFKEGYAKVKHFQLTNYGGSWVYKQNPNMSNAERKKGRVFTVETSPEVIKTAQINKEQYEATLPARLSTIEFAKKFAQANNATITHKSPSGSVYLELPNKETVRISDHWVLDREVMNPKFRTDWDIVQKHFDENDPIELAKYQKGGDLQDLNIPNADMFKEGDDPIAEYRDWYVRTADKRKKLSGFHHKFFHHFKKPNESFAEVQIRLQPILDEIRKNYVTKYENKTGKRRSDVAYIKRMQKKFSEAVAKSPNN